mmetsp:Transcript_25355/g.55163  ORF Transcript_25355/g.55163 Transcript_25355/m.55163 type:complete len:246 (-) Transcript_25355:1066-1803(-)
MFEALPEVRRHAAAIFEAALAALLHDDELVTIALFHGLPSQYLILRKHPLAAFALPTHHEAEQCDIGRPRNAPSTGGGLPSDTDDTGARERCPKVHLGHDVAQDEVCGLLLDDVAEDDAAGEAASSIRSFPDILCRILVGRRQQCPHRVTAGSLEFRHQAVGSQVAPRQSIEHGKLRRNLGSWEILEGVVLRLLCEVLLQKLQEVLLDASRFCICGSFLNRGQLGHLFQVLQIQRGHLVPFCPSW